MGRLNRFLAALREKPALQWWIVAGLTLLAAAVRFLGLGEWSFWGDEFITVERSLSLLELPVIRWSTSLLFTRWSMQWLGVSEASARLWPALVGTLTVPIIFLVVRRIRGDLVAWLSTILLALSTWHLYWSQNARFYSSLLLFYSLALLLFHLGLEQNRRSYLLGSLLFFFLAVQERAIGLALLPVLAAYLLSLRLVGLPRPRGLTAGNLFLYFGLACVIAGVEVMVFPALQNERLRATAFEWVNTNPLWIVAGTVYYLSVPVTIAAMAAMIQGLRDRFVLLLSVSALMPLIGIAVVSLFSYAANRYVFISLTSWLILSGVFLAQLYSSTDSRQLGIGLAVSLALILTIVSEDVLYFRYQNGNRDDWKSAFAFVRRNLRPEDAVLAGDPDIGEFYLDREVEGMVRVDLEELQSSHNRIWVVEDHTVGTKWPHVRAWALDRGRLIRDFDVSVRARVFEMNVYLVETASSPP